MKHLKHLPEVVCASKDPQLGGVIKFLIEEVPDEIEFIPDQTSAISEVSWDTDTGKAHHLRVGLKAGKDVPWDIAHELGHMKLGFSSSKVKTYDHERAAWEAALGIVRKFVGCDDVVEKAFEKRRDECLMTYEKP